MSRALKPGIRYLATLKLIVNVGEHHTDTNGIAWFPCDSTAFFLLLIVLLFQFFLVSLCCANQCNSM